MTSFGQGWCEVGWRSRAVLTKARSLRLLLLDVDGVLTDGGITYGSGGTELLTFHVRDGLAIQMAQAAGIRVAILSGRKSEAVIRRAGELGVTEVVLGTTDKLAAFRDLLSRHHLTAGQTAYVGDDVGDLPLLGEVGLSATVADAPLEVRRAVDVVTRLPGGAGAVRELIEALLRARGAWPLSTQRRGGRRHHGGGGHSWRRASTSRPSR